MRIYAVQQRGVGCACIGRTHRGAAAEAPTTAASLLVPKARHEGRAKPAGKTLMLTLDTNILARYVRVGGPARTQEEVARATVERGTQLFVAKSVVLVLEWVLRGVYGPPPKDACRVFEHLMSLQHVDIEDRAAVETALANLRKGLDFADALHHASSRACEALSDGRWAGHASLLWIMLEAQA